MCDDKYEGYIYFSWLCLDNIKRNFGLVLKNLFYGFVALLTQFGAAFQNRDTKCLESWHFDPYVSVDIIVGQNYCQKPIS